MADDLATLEIQRSQLLEEFLGLMLGGIDLAQTKRRRWYREVTEEVLETA